MYVLCLTDIHDILGPLAHLNDVKELQMLGNPNNKTLMLLFKAFVTSKINSI